MTMSWRLADGGKHEKLPLERLRAAPLRYAWRSDGAQSSYRLANQRARAARPSLPRALGAGGQLHRGHEVGKGEQRERVDQPDDKKIARHRNAIFLSSG